MSYVIEEETGTYSGPRHRHPHNGYHAGDFSDTPMATREQLAAITRLSPSHLPSWCA